MEEHIYTRLKVSETHGVKLGLFDKEGMELYDKHIWSISKLSNRFYFQRNLSVNGEHKTILFHRELLGLKDGEIRDHRNGNGLDNRLSNLRPATKQENNCNNIIRNDNTSGVKGVCWHKSHKKWQAYINYNGLRYNLGDFEDINEATQVVREKRIELHKEFANHG